MRTRPVGGLRVEAQVHVDVDVDVHARWIERDIEAVMCVSPEAA
jgi:hypothetical protein